MATNINASFQKFKNFGLSTLVLIGIVLIPVLAFWGVAKASQLLLPFFMGASGVITTIFIFLVLPLSLIRSFRPFLAVTSFVMSQILGVTTWMLSFIFIIYTLKFWGILFLFFFQLLSPVAIVGAMLAKRWDIAISLFVWVASTYLMRFYAIWLASISDRQNNEIVDVDFESKNISAPVSGKPYCPKCHKEYDETWKVCLKCSIPLKSAIPSLAIDVSEGYHNEALDKLKAQQELRRKNTEAAGGVMTCHCGKKMIPTEGGYWCDGEHDD